MNNNQKIKNDFLELISTDQNFRDQIISSIMKEIYEVSLSQNNIIAISNNLHEKLDYEPYNLRKDVATCIKHSTTTDINPTLIARLLIKSQKKAQSSHETYIATYLTLAIHACGSNVMDACGTNKFMLKIQAFKEYRPEHALYKLACLMESEPKQDRKEVYREIVKAMSNNISDERFKNACQHIYPLMMAESAQDVNSAREKIYQAIGVDPKSQVSGTSMTANTSRERI